jgi:PAS domain S-box-containing protein
MTPSPLPPPPEPPVDQGLLQRMFEESPVGTALVMPGGRFVRVNQAMCKIMGYSKEELLARGWPEIGGAEPGERAEAASLFARLTAGEIDEYESDVAFVRKDGEAIWLNVLMRAVPGAQGGPPHALLVARDAARGKRVEMSLRESEERFRQIASSSKDVFWVLDLFAPRHVYVNPAFGDIWGFWPPGGIMTYEQWRDSIHPEDRDHVTYQFEMARSGDVECNLEYRITRPDGSVRYLHDRGAVIRDFRGRPYRLAGVAIDITDRVEMERLKNEFISVVSHELRTPLTSVRASLGLIDGGVVGEVPEEMKALVHIAKEGSDRLVRLLNDLLDMERIESGRFDFRMGPADLVMITRRAVESSRALGEERKIELVTSYDVETAPVMADSDRIHQVINSLISNATKFSPEGATVELSLKRNGLFFRVAVVDFGAGIPSEFRGRVFEKFAQADSSTTRAHGGAGLGLSIARSIVERHGGGIGFDSDAGQGTAFYFDLPARIPGQSQIPPSPASR